MGIERITLNGIEYLSHDSLTYGDYGGFGSMGLANIRVIVEGHDGSVVSTGMADLRYASEGNPYGLADNLLADFAQFEDGGPAVLDAYGDYGSRQVWIAADIDAEHRYTAQLERYPELSGDETCQVEMEWEQEAWECWLRDDLLRTLDDDLRERADNMDDGALRDAYSASMEATNTCPTAEYNGVHVDVDRIAPAFADAVRASFGLCSG